MSKLPRLLGQGLWLLGICGVFVGLTGCGSGSSEVPFSSSPTAAVGSPGEATALDLAVVGRFRVGDLVTVTFSGLELSQALAPHEERIKEDGTITLPIVGSIIAKGKTAGELQNEIQGKYVPKFYQRLVVTVKGLDSFYYVGGEVKLPARQPWLGELTVTQAIQSAGDFTDFANRKNVQLIRADGTSVTVNCIKALKNPKLDPRVMPGDTVKVHRRWW